MLAEDSFQSPVELSVNGVVALTRFSTPLDIITWIQQERDFWDDLKNRAGSGPEPDRLLNQVYEHTLQPLSNFHGQVQRLIDQKAVEDAFRQAVTSFSNEFFLQHIIYSRSRQGRFVFELAKTNATHALRVALMMGDASLERVEGFGRWARAAASAEVAHRGWADQFPALDATLSEFTSTWDRRFGELEALQKAAWVQQQETKDEFNTLLQKSDEDQRREIKAHEELRKTLSDKTADAIADTRAQVEAIKETYNAQLTLQAPTTYWYKKQVAHRKIVAAWGFAFALLMGAGAWAVWRVWELTAEKHFASDTTSLSYGFLLPTIGSAFLAIWVLRIVSRQLLSNLVLSSEAGERVAMVKTFLALMQKPDHVKEADRFLILSALFRPSNRSDDDAAPPHWLDFLAKKLK